MADQEQSHTARRETEKTPRDMTGKVGQRHASEGDLSRARSPAANRGGTVGRDVPDESKEHHTEIAVEAGPTRGQHRNNNQ